MSRSQAENRECALERLMSAYGDHVMRTCRLFLQSGSLAEDASQETFIRAWKAIDTLNEGETEKAWLLKIAANTCRSMMKSRAYRNMERITAKEDAPEAGMYDQSPDHSVYEAVIALPDKYRLPVVLCYYQGLSTQEAAIALHLPGATVRTRLARARARLKQELKGWYFDEE